jgi:hypothetical protein
MKPSAVPVVGGPYDITRRNGERWRFRIDHLDAKQVYFRRWVRVGRKWEWRGAIRQTHATWAKGVRKALKEASCEA